MVEFAHGLAPVIQPTPLRNPGGDCFACALTAVMTHLFPEEPPTFDQVWESFLTGRRMGTEEKVLCNTWPGVREAVYELSGEGWRIEHQIDRVIPNYELERWAYHWGAGQSDRDYAYRLEGWLRSGWIAITEVQLHSTGKGGWQPDGYRQSTDHLVAIDGVRYGWQPHPRVDGANSMVYEVRVICSRKGAYWIEVRELLHLYGAASWHLVRRGDTR